MRDSSSEDCRNAWENNDMTTDIFILAAQLTL